jgi:hypothetical protein
VIAFPRRVRGCLFTLCLSAAFASARAQRPSTDTDVARLARDLGSRIVAAVAPLKQIRLSTEVAATSAGVVVDAIGQELRAQAESQGVRLVDAGETSADVHVACSGNLRDVVCTASIRKGDTRQVLFATLTRAGRGERREGEPAALAVEPVIASDSPILDLAVAEGRMLVLQPGAVTLYARERDTWVAGTSAPIVSTRPWPRDVRGRLMVEGEALAAFLPGTICRGTLSPLTVTCVARQEPWPIGIENTGMPADRNHFVASAIGAFTSVAVLSGRAGARWLVVGVEERPAFLGEQFEPRGAWMSGADEVTAVDSSCGSGRQVIAASITSPEGTATLEAFDVVNRRARAIGAPVTLRGTLTALWSQPGGTAAVAICRQAETGRYEAFLLRVACAR